MIEQSMSMGQLGAVALVVGDHTMLRFVSILPIFVAAIALSTVHAADNPSGSPRDGDIRQAVAAVEDSFNRGDAKGLAACWAPDGEFVGPRGERIDGRDKIEAAFREFLAKHQNAKLRLGVVSVRHVADDVALVDLVATMTPGPEGLQGEPSSSMVLVRRDGRWWIGSMRETIDSAPSHHGQLKNLSWMVGDWIVEDPGKSGVSMHSTCDWTASGSFLIRKFSVEGKNGLVMAGTEVIGWDPRLRQIRSWTFDADGGFGESLWVREGNRWMVKYMGTLADGNAVTVTHILTPVDANSLTLQSKDRTLNDQRQADMPEVTVTRSSPPKEPALTPRQPAKPRVLPSP
jgi:uncharacterized protein (TIGR02246 family)